MKAPLHTALLLIGCLLALPALLRTGWADSLGGAKPAIPPVNSVQSQFIQKKHLPILETPLISKGVFYYQAPRSLRWEYREPIRSILLMHDGRVRRFVDSPTGYRAEGGAGLQAMQVVLEEISQWLKGDFDQSRMFAARKTSDGKIILSPRDAAMGGVIQRIELHPAPDPGVLQRVVIVESEDAFTEMVFSHTVLNRPLAADLFEKAP